MKQTTTFSSVIPEEQFDLEVANFREQFEGRGLLDQVVRRGAQQMLQQAIEHVGKIDRAAVITDLQTATFDTVIGKIKMENNMPTSFWWVGQWQGGEFYGVGPSTNEGARVAVLPKPAWKAP